MSDTSLRRNEAHAMQTRFRTIRAQTLRQTIEARRAHIRTMHARAGMSVYLAQLLSFQARDISTLRTLEA